MAFGEKLKHIRVKKELSQADMAKLLGTTRQTINRYERSLREPNIRTAAKFAEVLGVSVEELTDSAKSIPLYKNELTDSQKEFLDLYEAAPPEIQKAARAVLESSDRGGRSAK